MSSRAEEPTAQPKQAMDGSRLRPMLELMRVPADRRLVLARITAARAGIRLEASGGLNIKMPLSLSHSLVLPTKLQMFGSTRDLFFSVQALLKKHVPMPTRDQSLLTYWAMSTWFPEFLPCLPSLVITGASSAADVLLQTLVAVCRRPILLAEANPAALRALPLGELMPTLLIRELQISGCMAALLDASTQPGYLVANGKQFQQAYCPKCIYIGEHPNDQPGWTHSIHVHVGGSSARSLHRAPTKDVISDFHNRLLAYRFLSCDKVAASKYRVSAFRPEICTMAEALGAVVVDDTELQVGIAGCYKNAMSRRE